MFKFDPWVGANYGSELPRLMVLGESHHLEPDEPRSPDITIGVVKRYIEAAHYCRWQDYFTKVQRVVCGRDSLISPEARHSFWDKVIFYNYVQDVAADRGHSTSPSDEMFRAAHASFLAVLAKYKPTHIIATGWSLWRHVTDNIRGTPVDATSSASKQPETAVIRISYGNESEVFAYAIGITHPSGGLCYATEAPRVEQMLRLH